MMDLSALSSIASHMPFLTKGPEGPVCLFCAAKERGKWRLHYLDGRGRVIRILTGTPSSAIECSPSGSYDGEQWNLSYVFGGAEEEKKYELRSLSGLLLPSMRRSASSIAAVAGFSRRDLTATAERHDFVHLIRRDGSRSRLFLPGIVIYAVSYRADQPQKLLISCTMDASPDAKFCVEYDLDTGEQNMIECDGQPAYKCSIYGDFAAYPKMNSGDPEDRSIVTASTVTRMPTNVVLGEIEAQTGNERTARTRGVITASNPLACVYRGEAIGSVGCGCGATGSKMTVYKCEQFGICTLRSPNKKVEFEGKTPSVCLGCSSVSANDRRD